MGISMHSGSDVLGIVPTATGFALLLIWGLFWLTGIKIRNPKIRFFCTLLFAISLSMLMGLMAEDSNLKGGFPGGKFGNWIQVNCALAGMEGFVTVLTWIAAFGALLLATDWLFIDYITSSLGLKTDVAPSPSPTAKKGSDLFAPRPVSPVNKPVKPPAVVRPAASNVGIVQAVAPPLGAAEETKVEEEEKGDPLPDTGSSAPWWSLGDEEKESPQPQEEPQEEIIEEHEERVPEDPTRENNHRIPKDNQDNEDEQHPVTPPPDPEQTSQREAPYSENNALLKRAIEVVFERREASIALLLNCMNIGYTTATMLIHELEQRGIVTPPGETGLRKVVISPDRLDRILEEL